MKRILAFLLVFCSITVLYFTTIDLMRKNAQPIDYGKGTLVFSDYFQENLDKWELIQSLDGKVGPLPENDSFVLDGIFGLSIDYDPLFGIRSDEYQAAYALSKETFPGNQIYVIEVVMSCNPVIKGSCGVWFNATNDDGNIFHDNPKQGFLRGFGPSFLSYDSEESGLEGLNYTLVDGWSPKCTLPIDGVDPFVFNKYTIVWNGINQFDGYVNDKYIGSCKDWDGLVTQFKIQKWIDNYFVSGWFGFIPNLFGIGYLNPQQPQYVLYKSIEIFTSP